MVKHVVMWRYEDKANIEKARQALESMPGKVEGLKNLQVGKDFLGSPASYDLVLITEHDSRDQLDTYQADPVHCKVKELLGSFKSERAVVDFEI